MLNAEIKIFPGKEMKALDMAEILDASVITSGIIQGCNIQNLSGALTLTEPGRILIRGRLGYFPSGAIPTTGISTSGTYKVLAVCDLSATQGNEFYIDYFSTATGGDYDAISSRRTNQQSFNASDGVEFVELGTATIDASTGNVTQWTPENATVKRDADAYSSLSNRIETGLSDMDTAWKHSVTTWVTYLQRRLFSADYFITSEEIVVPACRLAAGESRYVTCPAVRGSVVTATAVDNRSESIPQIPSFNPAPVEGVPTNIDNASARYIAKAITGIMLSNSTFVPRNASQAVGKNSNYCVLRGFNITGSERARKAYIWIRNTGTAEAIIDVHVNFMFVRRG